MSMKIEIAVEFFSIFFNQIPYGILCIYLFCQNDLRYSKKKTLAFLFLLQLLECIIFTIEEPFYYSSASTPTIPLFATTVMTLNCFISFFVISKKHWVKNLFFSYINSFISAPLLLLFLFIKNLFLPSELNVNNIEHYYELPYIILISAMILLSTWITYKLTDKHLRNWIRLSDFTLLGTYLIIYILQLAIELATFNATTTVTTNTFAIIYIIIPSVVFLFLVTEFIILENRLRKKKKQYITLIQKSTPVEQLDAHFQLVCSNTNIPLTSTLDPPILIKQMICYMNNLTLKNGSHLKVHIDISDFDKLNFSEFLFAIQQLYDFVYTQIGPSISTLFTITIVQEYNFIVISVSGKIDQTIAVPNRLLKNYIKHSFYLSKCEADLKKYIKRQQGKIEFITNDLDFVQTRFVFILNTQGKEV